MLFRDRRRVLCLLENPSIFIPPLESGEEIPIVSHCETYGQFHDSFMPETEWMISGGASFGVPPFFLR